MKNKLILLTLILILCHQVQAQFAEGCDGKRYSSDVWTSISKTTVKYAVGIPENQELYIDIYQPIGDVLSKRPLILLAHGGAFISGDKADMQIYCEAFAKKGFVTASLQYRLMNGWPTKESMYNALIEAVSDMKGAYRFFKSDASNANLYRVDTTKIFIGGYSAGALTALHTAYLDISDNVDSLASRLLAQNGGFEGNTGDSENRQHSTNDIFAVLNLSGALFKSGLLKTGDPILMSYHGDADVVVPIDSSVFLGLVPLIGSRLVNAEATAKNIPNVLVAVPGGGHTDIYTDVKFLPNLLDFYYKSIDLYYPRLCGFELSVKDGGNQIVIGKLWPNPASNVIHLELNQKVEKLLLYNSLGTFIKQMTINSDRTSLNISDLVPGTYYLLPIDQNKYYKSREFIKY